jgi:pimeloyl-ACP methyl ester carboxylesterase
MKRVLSFACWMLVSLILMSRGVAPASQAIAASPHSGEYSVTEQNGVQGDLPRECPVDWKSSVLYPVFARSQHFDQNDGAPGPLSVFYPSPDPFSDRSDTSMLDCGQYPLVIFLHGHRQGDPDIYKRWTRLPAALARSGYVVVVPRLPGNSGGQSPWASDDLDHAKAVLAWMQNEWKHHDHLMRSPGPAIVGHSYGALLGARLAPQIGASAYVSLSGGWKEFDANEWKTLDDLNVPSLFA